MLDKLVSRSRLGIVTEIFDEKEKFKTRSGEKSSLKQSFQIRFCSYLGISSAKNHFSEQSYCLFGNQSVYVSISSTMCCQTLDVCIHLKVMLVPES